ncbi:MAG: Uma2 family endonuclease [Chloroflexia bacterium]|nr:Uma2 family endonuclease [Chloroflexia bacterium]
MAVAQRIDDLAYERLVLDERHGILELRDGVLVEKPPMSAGHTWSIDCLSRELNRQLDPDEFVVSTGGTRLQVGASYLVPDLTVVPTEAVRSLLERDILGVTVYDDPMPLVVEVRSPSTGASDLTGKLPLYRVRGDREIWIVNPVERTLMAWVRRDDASYAETVHTGGIVERAALPGVRVDLGALFR